MRERGVSDAPPAPRSSLCGVVRGRVRGRVRVRVRVRVRARARARVSHAATLPYPIPPHPTLTLPLTDPCVLEFHAVTPVQADRGGRPVTRVVVLGQGRVALKLVGDAWLGMGIGVGGQG